MKKNDEDEIPGCTLGGAQDKFQAELINGQYVPVKAPGVLDIPSRLASPVNPAKLAAFKNVDGPPSIVDVIIGMR